MRIFDEHPDVIEWSSEEIIVPYKVPVPVNKNKNNRFPVRRYFPDFWVKKRLPNGEIVCEVIEVKPKKETTPPDQSKKNATPTGRISRRFLNEVAKYAINQAKWNAAENYCRAKGWRFRIMTEEHLGIK